MIRQEQIEQAKAELFPIGDNGRSYEQALSASGFDLGVKWADEHPREGLVDIDKACEWLIDKLDYCEIYCSDEEKFLYDFRKAMEE